jgi:hypothetical protein
MFKNKTLVIVAAVIILLLLGGAAYLTLSKSSTNQPVTAKTTPAPTTSANPGNNTTLAGLLALGQNLRCSFNVNGTNGGTTQGTFYVSNGNVRGDFVMKTADGKENQMSMIRIGDENYIWGSALPRGIKMKLSLDQLSKNAQASQFSSVNQKVDYNCAPWSVDSSLFALPTNVTFTDITSMMPVASPATGTGPQTQTQGNPNPCAAITNPTAKAACENAMHNNGY